MRKRPRSAMGRFWVTGCGFWVLQNVQAFSHTRSTCRMRRLSSLSNILESTLSKPTCLYQLATPQLDPMTAGDDDDDDENNNPRNLTDILLSYRSNIRRSMNDLPKDQAQAKKPLWSLVHFLEQQQQQNQQHSQTAQEMPSSLTPELITETVLPALHAAAQFKDYRLLLRIWDGTVAYCCQCSNNNNDNNNDNNNNGQAVMALPRLLSETLTCLGKTAASHSKIKRVWTAAVAAMPSSTMISARETNAYLKLWATQNKPGAALHIWRVERARGRTNAYSLALVLRALEHSVQQQGVESEAIAINDNDNEDDQDMIPLPLDDWKTSTWQWNQAVQILSNDILCPPSSPVTEQQNEIEWNNPVVVTTLLQLNHQVAQVDRRHPEAALAWAIYELFISKNDKTDEAVQHLRVSQPDVQLCTALLTCLRTDAPHALEIWQSMQQARNNLPRPNVYALAAILAACARAGEYTMAWKIMDKQQHGVIPNAVVYNTMLSALTAKSNIFSRSRRSTRLQRNQALERLTLALSILDRMQISENIKQEPDTVTYNTLFQVVAAVDEWPQEGLDKHIKYLGYESTTWPVVERLVHTLLDQMENSRIPRNVLTYRNAIGCVRSFEGVIQMVGRALKDETFQGDATDVFDAALCTLSQDGDMDGIQLILSKMIREGVSPTAASLSSVIRGLANGGHTRSIPFLIVALTGNKEASDHLFVVHKLDLQIDKLPPLDEEHLTTSITSCLSGNDFENARRILIHMRDRGLEPSDECLEDISRSYARLSLEIGHRNNTSAEAVSRAQSAFDIVDRLEEPPLSLQAIVARACAANGMFAHSQKMLQRIHDEALTGKSFRIAGHYGWNSESDLVSVLHRSILKSSANQGNITYALKIAEDIQKFGRECGWGHPAVVPQDESIMWSNVDGEGKVLPPALLNDFTTDVMIQSRLGMTATNWNYVLEAASKSGHWKVCINTLQFLRPHLLALHPDRIHGKEAVSKANEEYKMLSKGIISAAKCFAIRSQYGWAVRAIEDWIQWSGRRPPIDSIRASIRILSARGRSDEVYRLVANCLQQPIQDPEREGKAYEVIIYVQAITSLYINGLYDAADDVFIAAVSSEAIPFQLDHQIHGLQKRMTLDLHGMNSAVAHSAVRCALQQNVLASSWNQTGLWDKDLVIVTGRGKRSTLQLRPILRPEVQRMLTEEFFPPLGTVSLPGNTGALRVLSDGINEWVDHQRQQKGARMMAVAALLKDITSGSRLRQAFARAALAKPPDEQSQ